MNMPLKSALGPALAAGLALSLVAPAGAQDRDITVSTTKAMEDWNGEVTRDLGRNLEFAERIGKYKPHSGIVQIRFRLDENGRASDMKFHRSSGSSASDRAARWAVRRLTKLADVPAPINENTVFQANIIFAESVWEHAELHRELEGYERQRLASASPDSAIIALGS